MYGRINGLHKWRKGWRADVLRERDGGAAPLAPPETPPVDETVPWRRRLEGPRRALGRDAWAWWRSLGAPKFVLAPMIGQCDVAYRALCRENGVGLCYTQMYEAARVLRGDHDAELVRRGDGPLLVQLAGDDVDAMVAAGLVVQEHADGVDVNLGCPQACAESGNYGAVLLERDADACCAIVRALRDALDVPVAAKIGAARPWYFNLLSA